MFAPPLLCSWWHLLPPASCSCCPAAPAAPTTRLANPMPWEIALLTEQARRPRATSSAPLWLPTPTAIRCFSSTRRRRLPTFLRKLMTRPSSSTGSRPTKRPWSRAISCRSRATASCWKATRGSTPASQRSRSLKRAALPMPSSTPTSWTPYSLPPIRAKYPSAASATKRIRPTPRSS